MHVKLALLGAVAVVAVIAGSAKAAQVPQIKQKIVKMHPTQWSLAPTHRAHNR